MSQVDWLRDEPLSRLSAVAAAQEPGLTFIGPHCAVQRVLPPPSAGINLSRHGLTDGGLLLCTLCSRPQTPANLCRATAIDPSSHEALLPGCSGVVKALHAQESSLRFNVDCDASAPHRVFAVFAARRGTGSLSLAVLQAHGGSLRGNPVLLLSQCSSSEAAFWQELQTESSVAVCSLFVCVSVCVLSCVNLLMCVCVTVHSASCGSCGV